MPKKRGRPPKSTSPSTSKTPTRDVLSTQALDMSQIDDDDFAEIDNLTPKQAKAWLKNLDVLREKIKGKSVVAEDQSKAASYSKNKDLVEEANPHVDHANTLNEAGIGKIDIADVEQEVN
ncbi:hypothetical protein RIF29_16691 [Crotalaria pallida]|uniref:Uncharacterized protein n=1 Tax=Crotalaria pallida TaxID=3830 RepID=A0AAN9IDU7_CROPI